VARQKISLTVRDGTMAGICWIRPGSAWVLQLQSIRVHSRHAKGQTSKDSRRNMSYIRRLVKEDVAEADSPREVRRGHVFKGLA
jgi:hypothetical protein